MRPELTHQRGGQPIPELELGGRSDGPPQMDGPLPDEVGGVGSLVCRREVRNRFIAGTGTLASYWIKKTVLNIENKKIKLTH